MPPPPQVNAWWEPSTINAGENSTSHYASANVKYLGIICTGVGYSFGDSGGAKNTSWYYNLMYFSTAGVQNCGVQGANSAGQAAFVDAPLYINAAGTPAGSRTLSPPATAYVDVCDASLLGMEDDCRPPGPGVSSSGDDGDGG